MAVISEVVGVRNAGCVCVSIIAVCPGALKQPIFVCLILGVMATVACVRLGLEQLYSPVSVGLAGGGGGGGGACMSSINEASLLPLSKPTRILWSGSWGSWSGFVTGN